MERDVIPGTRGSIVTEASGVGRRGGVARPGLPCYYRKSVEDVDCRDFIPGTRGKLKNSPPQSGSRGGAATEKKTR